MWPKVGAIGIAGAIEDNTVTVTNIPHWPKCDGYALARTLGIETLVFINDFEAAG